MRSDVWTEEAVLGWSAVFVTVTGALEGLSEVSACFFVVEVGGKCLFRYARSTDASS